MSIVMSADSLSHQPVNHVFADVENLKSIDPDLIGWRNVHLHLFMGVQNRKLEIEVVEKLIEHSQVTQLIRCPKPGKNALDFVVAYHLGQEVQSHPKGYFHLVSKDKGFDALIDLLHTRKVKAKRHESWNALKEDSQLKHSCPELSPNDSPTATKPQPTKAQTPATKKVATNSKPSSPEEKLLSNLRKAEKSRPKKRNSLITRVLEILGKNKSGQEAGQLVDLLERQGHIRIDDKGNVTYHLGKSMP